MELDDSNSDQWSDLDEGPPALADASSEDEMVAARPLAETDSDISSSDDEDVHTSSGFANLVRSFANLRQIQAHLSRERELAVRMDGLIPGATPPGEERKAKKEQKMQEWSSCRKNRIRRKMESMESSCRKNRIRRKIGESGYGGCCKPKTGACGDCKPLLI